jgi:type 1 glutamine amidotransferase
MRWKLVLATLVTVVACGDNRTGSTADAADPPIVPIAKICTPGDPMSVLVITRQTYWNHPSNPVAADAIRAMAMARGWRVEVAGDPIVVTEDQLTRTDVIVFSLTSGVILDADQRALLERFFRSAGGFAGTHSASFTEWDWTFYPRLVPVSFKSHPVPFEGHLTIEAPSDPILAGLPSPWIRTDEYYTFDGRPEHLGVHVLLALDETAVPDSYPQDLKVGFHPITWTQERHGFRAFYTALGHTVESYSEPLFLQTLERGIAWAGADHHAARCGAAAQP